MKELNKLIIIFTVIFIYSCTTDSVHNDESSAAKAVVQNSEINTPDEALAELKAGNNRFLEMKFINTDYKVEIEHTREHQHPHSFILSCIDSRIPPEILFDQGIGHIFVARVAGNIEDNNILGSMEYAVKMKDTKLIVVMGHSNCGAVTGAIDNVALGNLTQLLQQIRPAITGDSSDKENMVNETAKQNVKMTIDAILKFSPVISDLVKENKVKVVGAFYDVATGHISFME
jgi:carbonic anhydrase